MVNNTIAYQKANAQYWDNPREKARRKLANRNRRAKGLYGKGRDKEIDHINNNPFDNSKKNLRVVPRVVNRRKGALKANGK